MENLKINVEDKLLNETGQSVSFEGDLFSANGSGICSLNGYWAIVMRNVLRTSFVTGKKTKRVHAVLASCDAEGNIGLNPGILELDGAVSRVIYTKGVFALKTIENGKSIDAVRPVWDLSEADFSGEGRILRITDSTLEGFIPEYGFSPTAKNWTEKVDSSKANSPYVIPSDYIQIHTVHKVTTVKGDDDKPIIGAWVAKCDSADKRESFAKSIKDAYLLMLDYKASRYNSRQNSNQQ